MNKTRREIASMKSINQNINKIINRIHNKLIKHTYLVYSSNIINKFNTMRIDIIFKLRNIEEKE